MYIQKLTNEEIFQFQEAGKPFMKIGLSHVTLKKHASHLLKQLQAIQPVASLNIIYHNSKFLPKYLNDSPMGLRGKVFLYNECPHQVHVAAAETSTFKVLTTLAHEYFHCVQFNNGDISKRELWDLENEADSFAYDIVVQYLKKGAKNG